MDFNDAIIIVSGLPRSGTSLMMQMLAAGSMPMLTDNIRKPDKHNPRGYYEYEKVKSLKEDQSWLSEAQGKAVKIVSPLLFFLPKTFFYKVIFMERNLEEIMASHKVMIGEKSPSPQDEQQALKNHLQEIKTYLNNYDCFEVLFIDYLEVINKPAAELDKAGKFLTDIAHLDLTEMARIIAPTLYRQKNISKAASGKQENNLSKSQEENLIEQRLKSLGYM